MNECVRIKLTREVKHAALRGHPWVYRSEIQDFAELRLVPGATVDVVTADGAYVGRGFFSTCSQIAVRLLSREPAPLDAEFFRMRLSRALEFRNLRAPWHSRRLVNSESDFLPGLIVDQYGEVLVLQTLTQGMEKVKETIVNELQALLKPRAIIEQNRCPSRSLEGLPPTAGILAGEASEGFTAQLGDVEYRLNGAEEQKTGLYLDQQVNYREVSRFVRRGMRVLDVFAYRGAFALHALLAGAKEAVAVEMNAEALAEAAAAAQRLNLESRLKTEAANAFDYLKAAHQRGEKFDLIVLDPPSFTRTRRHVAQARRGYKEIHVRALKMLEAGGVLATFCCSHHVSGTMFRDYILEAAADCGAMLRRELILSQSPDHPVLPAVPETEYLKGFVFSIA